jgi:predicted unusual protein kinase regulating ubiquinone biosynthesis (AarF/ABC1/UbiB family)
MSASRGKRAAKTAGLILALGKDHLSERVRASMPRSGSGNNSSQKIRDSFGSMRGVTAKIAQMASYLDTRVPKDMRDSLAQFQDNAVAVPFEEARKVVEADLGSTLEDLFDKFEEEPFAAASIGQVHRAITNSGEAVAVKIQYPEAREAIVADLKNTQALSTILKFVFPSMDVKDMTEEISTRIMEELDYRHEAKVQGLFYEYYQGHPTITIPKVYTDLSGDAVLTTELIEGRSFRDIHDLPQKILDGYGETIFRFVFRSLYQLKTFNGDPHPGNYIFLDNGKVAFLDFGFSRSFTESEMSRFMEMIRYMVIEHDPKGFRKSVELAGLVKADAPISDGEIYEYFQPYYQVVMEPIPMTITDSYSNSLLTHSFDRKSELSRYLNVPKSFVVIQRINLGLYAVLASICATANWRLIAEEIWPFVMGGPATEIGQRELAWIRDRDMRYRNS